MNFLRQSTALLRLNLGGLAARSGAVLTILVGVTCAVGVLVSMLAMGTGAHRQALGEVRGAVAVVVSRGSSGLDSSVSRDQATTVADLPGIALGSDGKPLIEYQSVVIMEGHRRGTGARVFFPLIGTSPTVTAMRPAIHFTEGRMFQPGLHELVVSNPCVRTFTGFELGAERDVRGVGWSVVGHFDQGNSMQCEVLADVETLMTIFGRNAFTNVSVELKSPRDFDAFRTALEANPALKLEARRERDQVEGRFKGFKALLNFAAYFVGAIMAVGATLGAVLLSAAAVDFEIPADEPPEASLTPTQIAGESFHVQYPVHSDGLMHHYVVESRFGLFTAYGRDALAVRLREVAALATIAKTSDTEVVLKSVSRGIEEDARSVVQVALNPVGTVIGIPKGIAHLFSGYKAEAGEIAAQVRQTSKGGDSHKKEGGRAELLRHAAAVTAEDEIEVFLSSTCLLLHFHSRTPVARVLAGLRVPTAQRADGHVMVLGAFDNVHWTEDVAAYEHAIREALPGDAGARELWLAGSASPRAHDALAQLGWEIHDGVEASLGCASSEALAGTAAPVDAGTRLRRSGRGCAAP